MPFREPLFPVPSPSSLASPSPQPLERRGAVRTTRRPARILAPVLLPLLLAVACRDAPLDPGAQNAFEMSGQVEVPDEARGNLSPEGVAVTATPSAGGEVRFTVTDTDGAWGFSGLPDDRWTVEFRRSGLGEVRLTDVPSGQAGIETIVPARSTAVVLDIVSTEVDPSCGLSPCLNLVFEAVRDGLFPDDVLRRGFRGFLGPSGNLSPETYEQTFTFIVQKDDPGVTLGETVVRIELQGLRSLDLLPAADPDFSILLFGTTEYDLFNQGLDRDFEPRYPNLATTGAQGRIVW